MILSQYEVSYKQHITHQILQQIIVRKFVMIYI